MPYSCAAHRVAQLQYTATTHYCVFRMVEIFTSTDTCFIVCTPNKSMNWRQAQLFLAVVVAWNLLIATGLLLAGAWPILPFMGLEIGGLAVALYYVQWKLSHREVIRIEVAVVHLEFGMHWPKLRYSWPRDQVQFALTSADSVLDSPQLVAGLKDARKQIKVGKNLNQDDLQTLVSLLKKAGVTVRTTELTTHTA